MAKRIKCVCKIYRIGPSLRGRSFPLDKICFGVIELNIKYEHMVFALVIFLDMAVFSMLVRYDNIQITNID